MYTKRVEMGLKSIDTSLMYREVYITTVFAITEISCDKLFHTGNARRSLKSCKYTLSVLPFHTVNVLRWV